MDETDSRPVVLITGASSGLGLAMLAEFKKRGFRVIAVSRKSPEFSPDLHISADLTDSASFELILAQLNAFCDGRLDLLINNAGMGAYETWESLGDAELRTVFELNFFAPVKLVKTLLPLLKASKGSIINVSSIAGHMSVPCMGAYCASKAAVSMFSDTLRMELVSSGVSVMNVTPGRIDTGFSKRSFGTRKVPSKFGGYASPAVFASTVFKAYSKRRRSLIYPRWYFVAPLFAKLFRPFYEAANLKEWKLR